ncbi:hypothetical protein A2331_05905 [Candidatus Falkowbacteria bacterium RIFOXYB2_FULL_34_18]|uniref:OmpA-like domain-containing protein n=1 Tax=Candidatus Falkowbacteria bacterium RIFOXYD2_FULL_34_120 TaxID=1798007 RepID=A0A1F5TP87_9BACT|nr:MAG: hypothetical protein A2331_05905 [Candidatus Falkowbacteria bacterium RIFOXYB2_FULL_34_18]OGF29078.1 MAG: hypothetical protein A2500_03490 [Candidatus Falkowbacteria bacterium RIFOXYC12_FULL_34_55]OGF36112.1 MAG: hypothetical protein A2466_03480 [Candidatus Falkowbacteria bacterium RIFOXYC2_FULL_34_220]OGF38564.1 MAG: hypothetical protein A2515_04740 [Candidatus Falkowbacteria bacterium RIFOXYD12_FULL_34_57]OGF40763.1 MAG: hypothetical protein A2531_07015 [Candidatus Falkowbacteria bact
MKKAILFVFVFMFVGTHLVFCEENTTVGVRNQNQTFQEQTGGTQSIIQNSYGANKVLHGISAPVDPDFVYIGAMQPGEQKIWREVNRYLPEQLYSKEEMKKIEESGEFIIQWTGKPLQIEESDGPAQLLSFIPTSENDIELWSVWMESTKNSFAKEDIIRMISKVRNKTHARRYVITVEVQLNPQGAGNSLSGSGGASFIPSNTAYAVGVGPMIGKSESRVFKIYHITVTGYNDGPAYSRSNVPEKGVEKNAQIQKRDDPWLIYLKDDFSLQEPQGIPYNVEWIKRHWKTIRQNNGKIQIICKGWPGEEKNLDRKALESMIEMGKNLISQNITEPKELQQIMKYGYDTNLLSKEKSALQKQNAKGVLIIKITQ